RQVAAVPPADAHFSRVFSRDSRYFTPALPIAFWQSFSLVSPRFRCSGSGVVQSRSEHLDDVSPRLPAHVWTACEAYRMARNSASSAAFQHLRHSANSVGVVTGSAPHCASTPWVAAGSKAQLAGKPSAETSAMVHAAAIFSATIWFVSWIFSWVVASGHGPGIFPMFSLSRHFSFVFR